ncbi:alpha/beta fold hydrolase, partial [Endomicrobium sp. AH-315-J14]|nr:alpha/beta fold hydrolase [Endomicrobium sp. AH-315-J14]
MKRAWALLILLAPLLAGCLSFHPGPLAGAPAKASFVEIDGVRLRYVDRGEGSPVVFVHGFGSSIENWRKVLPVMEREHRVIALDLKGFGWSSRPEGDYSPEAQARLVLGLMKKLGVDRAAVVGHSWGASVALAMALEAPQRVTKLALYDAWVFEQQLPTTFLWARNDGLGEFLFGAFYDERVDEKMALAFFDPNRVTEKMVEGVEESLARPGATAAALAAVRGQRYERLEGRYGDIAVPVLLLWGK